jgi:hypothetical protein
MMEMLLLLLLLLLMMMMMMMLWSAPKSAAALDGPRTSYGHVANGGQRRPQRTAKKR